MNNPYEEDTTEYYAFIAGAASRDAEIAELIEELTDLVSEIEKADTYLSNGCPALTLTIVRRAAVAASLANKALAKVRKS